MKFFGCVLLLFGFHAHASEIDSFTLRHIPLKDSLQVLNDETNKRYLEAVTDANTHGTCNKPALYKAFEDKLAAHLESQLEKYVTKHPEIFDQHKPKLKDSIYRDFFYMKWMRFLPFGKMGPLIYVNNQFVGADKIGHFYTEGLSYFKKVNFEGKPIEEAMSWGERAEKGRFGLKTTGVYSSGDLTANFNGMRFWTHLLGEFPDPLPDDSTKGPYVGCEDNKWKVVKTFNWADYLDLAWDEAYNCSQFRTAKEMKSVSGILQNLTKKVGHRVDCLADELNSQDIREKYQGYTPRLFNYSGMRQYIPNPTETLETADEELIDEAHLEKN
jgi:hypothetical protein